MRVEPSETIFLNGVLWTGRDGGAPATALAVAAGRIVAVGSDDDVMGLRGPDTQVVDLGRQTLLSGFIDAYAHIWKIGHLLTTLLDVRAVESLAGLAARLRDQASRLPAGQWLRSRLQRDALRRWPSAHAR